MRSHLITATRYKIVFLKTHTHLSNREIARKVKCSEGTVRYTLKRHRETGEVEERSGRGRKSLLNTQSLKQLDGIIKRRDTATSTELADEMIHPHPLYSPASRNAHKSSVQVYAGQCFTSHKQKNDGVHRSDGDSYGARLATVHA